MAEELFGYTQEEVIGVHLDDIVANNELLRAEALAYTSQVIDEEKRVHATVKRTRKDGSLVDVELLALPVIVEGEYVGAIAIYHDISDRLRYEEEIQSQKERVNEKIDHYQYELEHSLTKRAFFSFIQEKAHDKSYQNYLGLISIIRKDFEVLSELFEEVVIPKNVSKF